MLYYYATEAAARQGQARGSIYLSSATLVIGQQDVHKREYKHYFEVLGLGLGLGLRVQALLRGAPYGHPCSRQA